ARLGEDRERGHDPERRREPAGGDRGEPGQPRPAGHEDRRREHRRRPAAVRRRRATGHGRPHLAPHNRPLPGGHPPSAPPTRSSPLSLLTRPKSDETLQRTTGTRRARPAATVTGGDPPGADSVTDGGPAPGSGASAR